jgi:lysophospholipase L1-like esterase
MTLKSLILNVVLIAVSIVVTAAAIEYGTRLMFPALTPSGQLRFVAGKGDMPHLGPKNTTLRQIKNTGDFDVSVSFNKYGFRDSKDLAAGGPEDYFAVGDSLSFGWGVEENERYSDLIQAGIKRPVYNLCIPGGIDQFEKTINFAKKNGAKVKKLIMAISMGHNLGNYDDKAEQKAREETIIKAPKEKELPLLLVLYRPIKGFLVRNSAFYFLVTSFVHKNEGLKKIAVDLGLIKPSLEGIAHKTYSPKDIESTAQRTARLARQYDTLIVIAPSRALWSGTEEEKKTAQRIHREFVARLAEMGLKVADTRPAFEEEDDPLKNYFANDGHWSPKGHAAAARAILRHLGAP